MILHFKSEYLPQENLKTILIQTFGVKNKEHYGMLWYFLSGQLANAKIVGGYRICIP